MDAETWLQQLGEVLGIEPPSPEVMEALLDLAGTAAHASERKAAPLTTWMVARAGVSPGEALALARCLAETLDAGRG